MHVPYAANRLVERSSWGVADITSSLGMPYNAGACTCNAAAGLRFKALRSLAPSSDPLSPTYHGPPRVPAEAVRLWPTNAVYYSNRAAAYTHMQMYDEALADCRKAIELKPDFSKAYSRLGTAHFQVAHLSSHVAPAAVSAHSSTTTCPVCSFPVGTSGWFTASSIGQQPGARPVLQHEAWCCPPV